MIPNVTSNNRRDIVQVNGINYTEMQSDGDLADSKNISLDKFPYITTAKSDTELSGTGYDNAEAISGQQNLLVFADDKIYIDGSEFCEMPTSRKQTAFINGQMFVLPDEKLVAINNKYTISSINVSDGTKLEQWFNNNGIYAVGKQYFFPLEWEEKIKNAVVVYAYASLPEYKDEEETEYTYYYDTGGDFFKVNYTVLQDGKYYKSTPILVDHIFTDTADSEATFYRAADTLSIRYGYGSDYRAISANDYFYIKHTVKYSNLYYRENPTLEAENGNEAAFYYYSYPENSKNGEYDYNISTIGIESYCTLNITETAPVTKSVMSITAKATGQSGTKIILNKSLGDLLKANDNVVVTYGSNEFVGTVSAIEDYSPLTKNMITVQNSNLQYLPYTSGQWYTFKKLENPDFVCEWNNRLWCCNSTKQLIYASAQGKPDDFFSDMGLSIGAWQVTVGEPLPFTGMAKFESSLLLFKEDRIYRILGYSPKNYELHMSDVEGVKMGCEKSIVTVDGVLYFVGKHGVYAYAGGNPVNISTKLGNIEMNNAVGGTDGERYYLSFDSNGKDYLFAYDTRYGIWYLIDNKKVQDFAKTGNGFYYLTNESIFRASTGATSNDSEWHIQFTPFKENASVNRNRREITERKRYTRLLIRYELGKKSHMTVKTRIDGGLWQAQDRILGGSGIEEIRLPNMRCDSLELRIEGQGEATIYEIAREFEIGSDVR